MTVVVKMMNFALKMMELCLHPQHAPALRWYFHHNSRLFKSNDKKRVECAPDFLDFSVEKSGIGEFRVLAGVPAVPSGDQRLRYCARPGYHLVCQALRGGGGLWLACLCKGLPMDFPPLLVWSDTLLPEHLSHRTS